LYSLFLSGFGLFLRQRRGLPLGAAAASR